MRDDDKSTSIDGARRTLQALLDAGKEVNQKNWEEARLRIRPVGCSWRTTYRPHCAEVMAPYRPTPAERTLVAIELLEAQKAETERVIRIVEERDAEISRLKKRIKELEWDNERLSRGTKPRRRRKLKVQGRQNGSEDVGSD